MNGRLATVGFTPEEKTLLASMIAIVAIRTREQWDLVADENADVFLVNIDTPRGAIFAQQNSHRFKIIQYTQKAIKSNAFSLQKPMRARELLTALEGYTKAIASSNSQNWLQRLA